MQVVDMKNLKSQQSHSSILKSQSLNLDPMLFVAKKPLFISSNSFLNQIKKKYGVKKAGFSGTLDPFATGTLIIGFNQYTKLFPYLKKTPKIYIATIWIGAESKSLDIENIIRIQDLGLRVESLGFRIKDIGFRKEVESVLKEIVGKISYYPPAFSAKKINGKRAYELARNDLEVNLKKITSTIYEAKLLNFNPPFITIKLSVSEGSYIRSIAQIILKRLNIYGTLSYLNRIQEGVFTYNNEKPLNPLEVLDLEQNSYFGDIAYLKNGKKLDIRFFEKKEDGKYLVVCKEFFSIIEINNKKIKYILNSISLA